tara:strand:+ start:80 stop:892 length:813 start_codon:yes stop_codon:yes gene_type:complete
MNGMKKDVKGQVSVFVIIAVVVVVVAVGIVYFNGQSTKNDIAYFNSLEVKSDFDRSQALILNCYDLIADGSLDTVGIQGGYYDDAKNKRELDGDYEGVFIPYYYYEGEINIPSREDIEGNMEKYVEDYFPDCIDSIEMEGFDFNYRKGSASVSIKEKSVEFEVSSSVDIRRDGHSITFDLGDYPLPKNSALSDIYDLAFFISDSHNVNPAMYCISCVNEMAVEDDLYVDVKYLDDFSVLTIISENYTSSESYSYMFLNKYTGREVSTTLI